MPSRRRRRRSESRPDRRMTRGNVSARDARPERRPFRAVILGLCLAVSWTGGPPATAVPPAIPSASYYGPVRICEPHFAFDVRSGEGYLAQSGHTIWAPGAIFTIGNRWIPELSRDTTVQPLGMLELPDGVQLERVALSSPYAPDRRIVYLHDTGERTPWPKMMIWSTAFDGSDRDRAWLDRIAFGSRALALCPPPQELRPEPARDNPDAQYLNPTGHRGPLTICMADLAFDVGAEETVFLPWRSSSRFFRIVADGRSINVEGLFPDIQARVGPPAIEGSLARDPRLELVHNPPLFPFPMGVLRVDPEAYRIRLLPRIRRAMFGPNGGPAVAFTFEGASSEAGRLAFVERLRTQRPDDVCLDAVNS